MKRLSAFAAFAIALSVLAAGCSNDNATAPSATKPAFTAALSPANEVPAIVGAEATGSGSVTVTFDTTVSAGNITAATATFNVTMSGFPANTPINIAHIHPGAAGVNGSVLVNTGLTPGQVVLTTGSGTFTRGPVTVLPEVAQQIINNPSAYYFNIHSTLNPGGVARGQLVRQ
jgi:hypothetical protein